MRNTMTPDFVIVGAGLFGSVCAERLASAGIVF